MDKILVTVAGPDRAGVVYSVAEALSKLNCNFVDMSQTTVADQFSSIMIVNKPKDISKEKVHSEIVKIFEKRGFNMWVDVLDYQAGSVFHTDGEPFVVTVDGKNGKGLLKAFTRIFFEGKINIDNFRSINQDSFDGVEKVLLVFEITVPFDIDRRALHKTLSDIAKEQGVSLSMQHRQIFEAIHRVSVA